MTWKEYVASATHDDELLEERVFAELQGRLLDFWIEEQEDGIVLHGLAPNYHTKQMAQCIVMHESERPIVANLIAVRPH